LEGDGTRVFCGEVKVLSVMVYVRVFDVAVEVFDVDKGRGRDWE
jgi:hypothetical protein